MSEFKFHASPEERRRAWVKTEADYQEMYRRSVEEPEEFWAEIADEFFWYDKWNTVRSYNYDVHRGPVRIEWFDGGKTNITVNALDRHLDERGDQVALIWEGNAPGEDRTYTYRQLYEEVNRFANVLRRRGVGKGDRVAIYMPMVPELAIAMLATARIGAVHSIVFGGFSAEALADRIVDAEAKVLVTTDGIFRGTKVIGLKGSADRALQKSQEEHGHRVEHCFVVRRTGQDVEMTEGRDLWWHEEVAEASTWCEPEVMDAEDPLFILYTSGSTGKPKGVLHTIGGYMVYTGTTFKHVFDYHDGDIWWCTADIGWVTGHSYIVYGPLTQGATTVMFEGVPSYPDPGRFWDVVDKWKVTQFYTAPTAIRALMKEGPSWVDQHDLSSLRVLGSVGEPINPEAWQWYFDHVGKKETPIVDTWWQTETGGILISALPYAIDQKPGSATRPFFGVVPAILDGEGRELDGEAEGVLVIKEPWPGQMRTIWGDHKRFEETYFQLYPGRYFSGDGSRRDEDGYYWITGRVDDVINVSGHRMGTAEVESALVAHWAVAEAAVVGCPHDIKGQGIYAYVTLLNGIEETDKLKQELIRHVRTEIGPIATPDEIHFSANLPKTRSGKIMRRILRKVAARDFDTLGDTSTLAEPAVLDGLIERRKAMGE